MDWGTWIVGWTFGVWLMCGCGCWGPAAPNSGHVPLRPPLSAADDEPQAATDRESSSVVAGEVSGSSHVGATRLILSGVSFARLPPGQFLMGSEDWRIYGEGGRCEQPQHRVRITVAYYLSTHEVTRGAFQRFVTATGYRTEAERDGLGCNGLDASRGAIVRRPACVWHHPGFEQTAAHPVVCVSWNDARAYCQWLADQTGRSMRLPTEAEWEYACRSGSDSRYSTGESPQSLWGNANLADIALQRVFRGADWAAAWDDGYPFTAPVGLFRPNAFGLYDMHGNVGEWCSDWFDGEYYSQSPIEDPGGPVHARDFHVVRGGSWYNHGLACRAANRHDGVPTARSQTNGFRVAFSADSPEK